MLIVFSNNSFHNKDKISFPNIPIIKKFLQTQYSIVPTFHYSNWGEAPKFLYLELAGHISKPKLGFQAYLWLNEFPSYLLYEPLSEPAMKINPSLSETRSQN